MNAIPFPLPAYRFLVEVTFSVVEISGSVEYTVPLTMDSYLLGEVRAKLAVDLDLAPNLISVSRIKVLKTMVDIV